MNKLVLMAAGVLAAAQFSTAYAAEYAMPANGDGVVGEVQNIRAESGDTLLTIGNRYGLGMHEMLEANPNLHLDQDTASKPLSWRTKVVVPTQFVLPPIRKGIVINMPELRLYYFTADGSRVYTYPVGMGRDEWRTPLAQTTVISKETDPVWRVPPSIHKYVLEESGKDLPAVVEPGPENPLGPYALRLGTAGYLIHGTNQPWSIGKYVSSGCIRLHNEDITELYEHAKVGTPVAIVNYANKAAWSNGRLYFDARVPMQINAPTSKLNPGSPEEVINSALKSRHVAVDWDKVAKMTANPTGIPQPIGGRESMANAKTSAPIKTAQTDDAFMGPNTVPIQVAIADDTAEQTIYTPDQLKRLTKPSARVRSESEPSAQDLKDYRDMQRIEASWGDAN